MIGSLDLPPLPEGWVWTKVGEIMSFEYGKGLRKDKRDPDGTVPVYGSNGIVGHHSKSLVKEFSLIVGRKGAVGEVHASDGPCWPIDTTYCIVPPKGIAPHFLFYLLSNLDLRSLDKSTAIPGLNRNDAYALPIPLPPLPEQHRIVVKIEELFTKLDAGVESLEKTKAQLKRYRQAVLKHAFEGKLTEVWRETHREIVEPASELLRNTLEEKAKQTKKKTKSFPQMGGSELRPLLDEWLSLTLDYLASSEKNSIKRGPFGSSIKKEFFVPSGYKVYEQKNVIYNDFERGDYFVDEKKFEELKDFEVKSGDVLMSCSGTVGKIAIAPEGIQPGIINQALLKISLDNDIVSTRYFVYLFRSKINEIILKNTRGSAMVNISSVKDLKQIPFPIPSKIEQVKIVEEIERRFSVADDVEKAMDQSLKQAERLRHSILKTAFEGKLMPQDPTDEPASVLLERIKAEREKREIEAKSKTKNKRKRDLVLKQRRFNDYVK